jgi:predicted RNase H-like HicB family nuclease
MTYKVAFEKTDEAYHIWCPGLPGCWSQGDTEAEAIENIRSAIHEYLLAIDDQLVGREVREVQVPA